MGYVRTEAIKAKWRAKMEVVWASPEWKKTRAEAMRAAHARKSPEEKQLFGAKISKGKKGISTRGVGWKHSAETRLKMSEIVKKRGANNHFYKDGRGHERDTARRWAMKGVKYKLWREAVFERDNYTCTECGDRGGTLHADHILRWKDYPELRFDVSNGQTLCVGCHLESPTYGNRQ
jgi:ribosomal protein S27AE